MSEVSKEACLVSLKFKSQLTSENGKEAPKVSKYLIQGRCWQDQGANQVRLANYTNELSCK